MFEKLTTKKKIRYRSIITNVGSPVFKIRVILLVFHIDGNLLSFKDLLKNDANRRIKNIPTIEEKKGRDTMRT